MPNLPIRGLGSVGVITDVAPYNIPLNAFSRAKNVRFDNGNILRSPCFRDVETISAFNPIHIKGIESSTGYDTAILVSDDFDVYEYENGSITLDLNTSASSSTLQVTTTSLANVNYINREDQVPLYRTPSMNNFANLVNWPSGTTCKSLRSFGDFLLALNTIESGSNFSSRVRFSNIALANNAPDSWDATDTTKLAGFNDLAQIDTQIIDGATLGSNFIIYASNQVWLMEFVGGTFIFNFRKLFDDVGIVNQNCVIEVGGRHYVFDNDDIYTTDGQSVQSIADGRVKDYIFSSIDSSSLNRCFVMHDSAREEVYFCYKSGDDMAEYTNGDGCNRAAVYNYVSNTWSFVDLPNVYSGSLANVDTVETFASIAASSTYSNFSGSYIQQDGGFTRVILVVSQASSGDGLASNNMFGMDNINENVLLSTDINTGANKGIFLERVGIDLDQEAQLPLTSYKNIRSMVPQLSTPFTDANGKQVFNITMGSADLVSDLPAYGTTTDLDILQSYKVDSRAAGRYLSYKIQTPEIKDMSISGFDFDVVSTGRR